MFPGLYLSWAQVIDSASDFLNPDMKKCISIPGLKEFDTFPDSIDSNSMNMELFFWFKIIGSVSPLSCNQKREVSL